MELPTHSQLPHPPSDSVRHYTATGLCRSADTPRLPQNVRVHLELPRKFLRASEHSLGPCGSQTLMSLFVGELNVGLEGSGWSSLSAALCRGRTSEQFQWLLAVQPGWRKSPGASSWRILLFYFFTGS